MRETVTPSPQPLARRASARVRPLALSHRAARSSDASDVQISIRLRPRIVAPSLARNRARWLCARRSLTPEVVRDVVFIAGELVAISVRQVHAPLDLDIRIAQATVTVRVHDLGAGRFAQSTPNGVGTSQSLQLIRCVAQSWGVSVTEDGRELWASVVFGRARR